MADTAVTSGTRRIKTAATLAELLGVNTFTVYRLAERGEIPFFRVGAVLRFDVDAVLAHIARGPRA